MSASIAFSKTSVGADTDCEWVVCHFRHDASAATLISKWLVINILCLEL